MVTFFKAFYKYFKLLYCKLFKKKVIYTKSQLEFQKELEEVKKQIQEAKEEINQKVEEPNGNTLETPINPKDKAYSIVFDEKLNKFMAVEITFDLESGTLGGMKIVESNPNKYIIIDRFNVLVGRNLL